MIGDPQRTNFSHVSDETKRENRRRWRSRTCREFWFRRRRYHPRLPPLFLTKTPCLEEYVAQTYVPSASKNKLCTSLPLLRPPTEITRRFPYHHYWKPPYPFLPLSIMEDDDDDGGLTRVFALGHTTLRRTIGGAFMPKTEKRMFSFDHRVGQDAYLVTHHRYHETRRDVYPCLLRYLLRNYSAECSFEVVEFLSLSSLRIIGAVLSLPQGRCGDVRDQCPAARLLGHPWPGIHLNVGTI